MNTCPPSRQQQGHTIVLTLVVSLVLGVVLLGIIKLANNEGQMTGRSQNWNAVMPLVEAGIEEAFSHLKYSPTNRAENGWTFDAADNRYIRTRNFQDGMYKVTISKDYDPVIISRGWLRAPGQNNFTITRAVRVRATNSSQESKAPPPSA
jgi:Tfp pilus assembly protein PilX